MVSGSRQPCWNCARCCAAYPTHRRRYRWTGTDPDPRETGTGSRNWIWEEAGCQLVRETHRRSNHWTGTDSDTGSADSTANQNLLRRAFLRLRNIAMLESRRLQEPHHEGNRSSKRIATLQVRMQFAGFPSPFSLRIVKHRSPLLAAPLASSLFSPVPALL
jgi:hypothetical protein